MPPPTRSTHVTHPLHRKRRKARRQAAAATVASAQAVPHSPISLWVLRLLLRVGCVERRQLRFKLDPVASALSLDEETLSAAREPGEARDLLEAALEALEADPPERSGAPYANVTLLAGRLGLTVAEAELLAFATLLGVEDALQACFESLGRLHARKLASVRATTLDVPVDGLRRCMLSSSPLWRAGLVRVTRGSEYNATEEPLHIADSIREALWESCATADDLFAQFFPATEPATVSVRDYPHVATDCGYLERLLRGAFDERARGVNVLLHGGAGTGKTQLSRALGKALGVRVVEVPFEARDGDRLDGRDRLAAYQLAQALLGCGGTRGGRDGTAKRRAGAAPPTLVVFDEAEDVFPPQNSLGLFFAAMSARSSAVDGVGNKAARVRMLEENPVPTIWISNAVGHVDPAVLRRFSYSVQLRQPPAPVRRKMLEQHLSDLPVGRTWLETVASDDRVQPGHIERAAHAVRLMQPADGADAERALRRTLEQSLRAQGKRRPPQRLPSATGRYDLSLVNTSCDLGALTRGLGATRRGSVCMYGPPGTGKTAFAEYLRDTLGLPLAYRRASDILGCYVGETEHHIAEAFASAADTGSILFFDEADSFLRDRTSAHHSWEATQVNELLSQMEHFDGILLCATNLLDDLDRAALRRFSAKVRFDALTASQRVTLLDRVCRRLGLRLPKRGSRGRRGLEARLIELDGLTAGDYAAVARRFQLTGASERDGARDRVEALVATLEEELSLRERGPRKRVGFGVR